MHFRPPALPPSKPPFRPMARMTAEMVCLSMLYSLPQNSMLRKQNKA
jgi:hypothetical protein